MAASGSNLTDCGRRVWTWGCLAGGVEDTGDGAGGGPTGQVLVPNQGVGLDLAGGRHLLDLIKGKRPLLLLLDIGIEPLDV